MKRNSLKYALCGASMFFICSAGGAAPWEGFYGGVSAGHASSDTDEIESRLGTFKGDGSGALAGVQVGYNFRLTPTFVVGFQNDFYGTRIKAGSDGLLSPQVKIPLLATGRLRGGSLMFNERLFLYGTGGVALGQIDDAGEKKTKYGASLGAGMEWAWSPALSTSVEVLATRLSKDWNKGDNVNTDIKFKTVTVGLNYHF